MKNHNKPQNINYLQEYHEQLAEVPAWGGTTDPIEHDPQQYRYLVHAINPFSSTNAMTIMAYDARDGITYDKSWGDQSISMYDQPERIGERVSLSMSLIDQDHTAAWGEAGLIVEAPEQNVVLTSNTDAGAHNNNLDFLLTQADKHGVQSGDELLRRSNGTYNEVVAVANRDGQQVQLKGFFYKTIQSGEPSNRQLAMRMQAHAARLGLPVVAITEPGPYAQDKVETTDSKLAVHFNGSRFLLDGYESKHLFTVYDERGHGHFASPQEIEPALGFAVASGNITEAQAAEIASSYREADELRQTPKAEFDEDGFVKEITYRSGYGANEEKTSLGKSGHGYHTNLAKQAEKIQESTLNAGKPQMIEDRSYRPVSPADGDQMVEAAVAKLSDEQATQVRQWYAEHRSVLEKQWGHHLEYMRSMGRLAMSFDYIK